MGPQSVDEASVTWWGPQSQPRYSLEPERDGGVGCGEMLGKVRLLSHCSLDEAPPLRIELLTYVRPLGS